MCYILSVFSSSKCSLFHNSNISGSSIINILYIYSTNTGTKYFKCAIYSPFFPLQNAVCFIILTCLVPLLFTFYIQGVLKLKKNSGAKRLIFIVGVPTSRQIKRQCNRKHNGETRNSHKLWSDNLKGRHWLGDTYDTYAAGGMTS